MRIWLPKLLVLALLASATVFAIQRSVPRETPLQRADRLYDQRNYKAAQPAYLALIAKKGVPANRTVEVAYRLIACAVANQKWDSALKDGLKFVQGHIGTVWEPRGLTLLAQAYLKIPHRGYLKAGRNYRGDAARTLSANGNSENPYKQFDKQDYYHAVRALEAALELYPKHRKADEESVCTNLLAHVTLQQEPEYVYPKDDIGGWKIDLRQPYSIAWTPTKKAMYLFEKAKQLAQTAKRTDLLTEALVTQSLWLAAKRNEARAFALNPNFAASYPGARFPYRQISSLKLLEDFLKAHGDEKGTELARIRLATLLKAEGSSASALAFAQKSLPKLSPEFQSVAQELIEKIQRPSLQIGIKESRLEYKGTKKEFIACRNVAKVNVTLYRLPNAKTAEYMQGGGWNNSRIVNNFFAKKFGKKVQTWELAPKYTQSHGVAYLSLPALPTNALGGYIFVVSAKGAVAQAHFMPSTRLQFVVKQGRQNILCYVTNRKTGKPIANAIVHRQLYYRQNPGNPVKQGHITLKTDASGLCRLPNPQKPYEVSTQFWAQKDEDMVAISDYYDQGGSEESTEASYQGYVVTDRAVYRPAQNIEYRAVIFRKDKQGVRAAAGETFKLMLSTPKRSLQEVSLKTNAYGAMSGSVQLADDADLGEYSFEVKDAKDHSFLSHNFSVEEYKKPEFEGTISLSPKRPRPGQSVTATLRARYYSGDPVPNAKIVYRIERVAYWNLWRWEGGVGGESGMVERQGSVVANAQGEATVTFQTSLNAVEGNASRYVIHATITDAARRAVDTSAGVTVSKTEVSLMVEDDEAPYRKIGEEVPLVVHSINTQEEPQAAEGVVNILLVTGAKEKERRLVAALPVQTNAKGEATLLWTPREAGEYNFETVVNGVTEKGREDTLLVLDPSGVSQPPYVSELYVLPVDKTYAVGERAKVYLLAPEPNSHVLLTHEAERSLWSETVVSMPKRMAEIEVPLTTLDAPNFSLDAVWVRNGKVESTSATLLLATPPQDLKVTAEADKAEYRPGDTVKLRVHVRDAAGKPLQTEFCLAVSDAALDYIRKRDGGGYETGNALRGSNIYTHNSEEYTRRSYTLLTPYQEEWSSRFLEYLERIESGQTVLDISHRLRLPLPYALFQSTFALSRQGMGTSVNMNSRGMGGGAGGTGGGMGGGGRPVAMAGMAASRAPASPGFMTGMKGDAGLYQNSAEEMVTPSLKARKLSGEGGKDGKTENALQTRSNFQDVAYWTPAAVTDANGEAEVSFPLPDNLTRWKAFLVGNTPHAEVGTADAEFQTHKPLQARLNAPRFLVEQDQVVLTANLQNSDDKPAHVKVNLQLNETAEIVANPGKTFVPNNLTAPNTEIEIPPNSEKRLDWVVQVKQHGEVRAKLTALAQNDSDAMEITFPSLLHGIQKSKSQSGSLREKDSVKVPLVLPTDRLPNQSQVIVYLSPSLAATMLDALPYLADYPYGCVEQTMSRFLPSLVVAQSLKELGYSLEDLRTRAKQLEASEGAMRLSRRVAYSPYTYSEGSSQAIARAALVSDVGRWKNPVFDEKRLKEMLTKSVTRLRDMQHPDGGWGWWKDDKSDPQMTAYVLYGLGMGAKLGASLNNQEMQSAYRYLSVSFKRATDPDNLALMARSLAFSKAHGADVREQADALLKRRDKMSLHAQALLALALAEAESPEKAKVAFQSVAAKLRVENNRLLWNRSKTNLWSWQENENETLAALLQVYLALEPKSPRIPLLVQQALSNRRGAIWNSTKETATLVLAIANYLKQNKELSANYTLKVVLDGKTLKTLQVTPQNALFMEDQIVLPEALLKGGKGTLEIVKEGEGACYYSIETRHFTDAKTLLRDSNNLRLKRTYTRLQRDLDYTPPLSEFAYSLQTDPNPFLAANRVKFVVREDWSVGVNRQSVLQKTPNTRTALQSGSWLQSGDEIEVEIEVDSPASYDYVMIEDIKPAGCEPLEQLSGEEWGRGISAHVERRDQKTAFFLTYLPQGKSRLVYRLRAESPGAFHVLPTHGYAMYAPQVRAITDENRLGIRDLAP